MKTLIETTQGVKGGNYKTKKTGFVCVKVNDQYTPLLDIDNFEGSGNTFKQRDEPLIRIYGVDNSTIIFTGTHEQLVEKLSK